MSAPEHVLTVARGTGEGQQSVSVSGTSAATSNAIGADECVVYANVECFVLAGSNPTATVAAGTPLSAGQTIRLRIPELNEQRRKEMVKVAQKYAEAARVAGLRPRLLSRMAFSTAPTMPRSQTATDSMRGSGTETVATWFIGILEP